LDVHGIPESYGTFPTADGDKAIAVGKKGLSSLIREKSEKLHGHGIGGV
jgi:hypothetical protein